MLKPLLTFLPLLFMTDSFQQPATTTASSVVPVEADRMVNPVKPTPESQARAKKMYGYECAVCHGESGNGKGDLVADMKLTLKDYTDPAALKDLSDGRIFYIIKNGRGRMPGEGDRATPEDIWNMVIYVRSFAKKDPTPQ